MVALLLSLLAQVGIPGTWIAFRFRPADATSFIIEGDANNGALGRGQKQRLNWAMGTFCGK